MVEPENSRRIARQLARSAAAAANVLKDEDVQEFISKAVINRAQKTQVAPLIGKALSILTAGNRHQALLDDAIRLLAKGISENQDLKNEESSDLKKETSLNQQLAKFDVKPNAFSVLPELEGSSADALKGTANVSKKGKFTARVTAVVVDVLPNGNLVVNGRREIRIDQDTKLIEFSGIVRRWDISANNTIPSELVAEAKVSYAGTGPMADSTQRKGLGKWIHDAIQWIWPF